MLPSAIQVRRGDPVALPRTLYVTAPDPDRDYQVGTQQAIRAHGGAGSSTVRTVVVLTATEQKQLAEALLAATYTEQNAYQFQLPIRYLKLLPGDVVNITNGAVIYALLITRTRLVGMILEVEAVASDAADYVSYASGDDGFGGGGSVSLPGPTDLLWLDTPPLRDTDGGAPGVYVAMHGYLVGWRGAVLYEDAASDGIYVDRVTCPTAATCGVASTVLGGWITADTWDVCNSVTVMLASGALSSASRDALIADRSVNAALIGDEIVQFADTTLVSAGTYTLSNLLRYRQGTEWAMHAIGERFVLLDGAVRRLDVPLSSLNTMRNYRAVSFGLHLEDVSPERQVMADGGITPLAPCHLDVVPTGSDYLVRWVRRARVYAAWADGLDVPLDEATESYQLTISQGGVVKLTRSVTTTSATVTAADLSAEGLPSTLAGCTVAVCQVSDEGVLGRAISKTL